MKIKNTFCFFFTTFTGKDKIFLSPDSHKRSIGSVCGTSSKSEDMAQSRNNVVCMKHDVASFGGVEKQDTMPLRWFGVNEDVTKHLLQYIPEPRTLYNLSMTSKTVRQMISLEVVIKCGMFYGGRPFATLFKLSKMMNSMSIYPVDAMRLL